MHPLANGELFKLYISHSWERDLAHQITEQNHNNLWQSCLTEYLSNYMYISHTIIVYIQ